MKDNYGRTIDYLRISLTDRCNLRCVYCMPPEGITSLCHEQILTFEEITRIVERAAALGIKHVRLTGGEPLVRKGCVRLAEMISSVSGIESVGLTTNAILLPQFAEDLRRAGVSLINISLDTLDPLMYHAITRLGTLDNALAGIEAALSAGFPTIKINVVAVRSLHQNWESFARLTLDNPLHVRFIEYMPVGYGAPTSEMPWGTADVIPTQELIEHISSTCMLAGLGQLERAGQHTPNGYGPAEYYRLPNSQGTIGFISSVSNHFCGSCNRLRLTADGKIRPCLFSDEELDVGYALRHEPNTIDAILLHALNIKPASHASRIGTQRMMSQIGG